MDGDSLDREARRPDSPETKSAVDPRLGDDHATHQSLEIVHPLGEHLNGGLGNRLDCNDCYM
jgi:hypothetical protein